MWHLHDRLEEHITEENCRSEIASFAQHGQRVPVLGRALTNDSDHDVELIYGARRLYVARQINVPLLVEMREMSDKEALIAMDVENRQRMDISAYERGLSYARWLRLGYFESQEEIARFLSVSAPQVSRLLKMARLPTVVVAAFSNAADICESWGVDLSDALDDADRRKRILLTARELGVQVPRCSSKDTYRRLLSSSTQGRKPKTKAQDKVVRDHVGTPLFRVKYQRKSISLVLPIEKVSADALSQIETAVAAILDPGLPRPTVETANRTLITSWNRSSR
jgi:ParB family chromosome partitioning protein